MENIINDKQKFYKWIIDALKPDKSLSAYQVALILKRKKLIPLATRQAVQPRMTELKIKGIIKENGKIYDKKTKRYVTAYVLA